MKNPIVCALKEQLLTERDATASQESKKNMSFLFSSPQPETIGHSDSMVLIKDQMYFQTLGIPSVHGSVIPK